MKKLLVSLLSVLMVFGLLMPISAEGISVECSDYDCLVQAIDDYQEITIEIKSKIELKNTINIDSNKTVVINLNGNTLYLDAEDSSTGRYAFDNKGILTINGDQSFASTVESRGIYNRNGGKLTVSNVTSKASGTSGGAAYWIYGNTETTITGGRIDSTQSAIYTDDSGENTILNIENVNIEVANVGIRVVGEKSKATIKNTTIESGSVSASAVDNATLEGDNVTITCKNTWNTKNYLALMTEGSGASIDLTNSKIFTKNGAGGVEANNGSVVLTNVEVTVSDEQEDSYTWIDTAFAVCYGGTLTLNDCKCNSIDNGIYVFNSGGTINVNGGTYECETNAIQIDTSENAANTIVNVSDGSFDGGIKVADSSSAAVELVVKGGTFSSDPSTYVDKSTTALATVGDTGNETYAVGSESIAKVAEDNPGETVTITSAPEGTSITLPQGTNVENKSGNTVSINGTSVKAGETIEAPAQPTQGGNTGSTTRPSRPSSPSKDLPSNTEECQKEFGKDYIYSKELGACIIKYLVVDTSTK